MPKLKSQCLIIPVTTTTPGSLPVAEYVVAQVLLADTFIHSGFHPAVSERSPSTTVSVEY